MFGAAAMSLSSFCVVTNALRLNLFNMRDPSRDHKRKAKAPAEKIINDKEIKAMTKTLKIEGMMCSHCEARVKKALEALPGVEDAKADHEAGTAVVTLSAPVDNDAMKKAVEEQDYKVISIE